MLLQRSLPRATCCGATQGDSNSISPTGHQKLPKLCWFGLLLRFEEGSRVLDLFSGSGIVGLESASRGAGSVLSLFPIECSVTVVLQKLQRVHSVTDGS